MNKSISLEKIEGTKIYKKLPPMKKTFTTKKANRVLINDGLAICRNIGFEIWSKSCGQNQINIDIVKELFEKEKL